MSVSNSIPTPLRVRSASQLEQKEIRWLWDGWLPLRNLALIDGDRCLGKSLLTLDLSAHTGAGRPMPDGSPGAGKGSALVLNAENRAALIHMDGNREQSVGNATFIDAKRIPSCFAASV